MLRLTTFIALFLFFAPLSFAETLISYDVVQDTTWTKDMSPIILERSSKDKEGGNYNIHVINGATLTIEAGVEIYMTESMNLRVVRQCQRDYYGKCVRGEDGEIRYARIHVNGTEKKPVIFSSLSDYKGKATKPGEWGNIEALGNGNIIKNARFSYGGMGSDFMLKIEGNSIFENSIVHDSLSAGVLLENTEAKNNKVYNNAGVGMKCKGSCNLSLSAIFNNKGDGLILDAQKESKVSSNYIADNTGVGIRVTTQRGMEMKGNFVYNNADALIIDSLYNEPLKIVNNFFSHNAQGITTQVNFENILISKNNFLDNAGFAIQVISPKDKTLFAPNNWFGIDSGATDELGKYYVHPKVDVTTFKSESIPFNLLQQSAASVEYANYKKTRRTDTKFLMLQVERAAILGSETQVGALYLYKTDIENIRTKGINNLSVEFDIPADQQLSVCSVNVSDYKPKVSNLCSHKSAKGFDIKTNRFTWKGNIPALDKKTVYFAALTKPAASYSLPQIYVKHSELSKNIGYSLDTPVEVHTAEVVVGTVVGEKEFNTSSSKKLSRMEELRKKLAQRRAQRNSSTNDVEDVSAQELANKFYGVVNLGGNSSWKQYPLELRKEAYSLIIKRAEEDRKKREAGALMTGKMETRVVNNQLQFVLVADDGNEYRLLNSQKWEDLIGFIRSDKKQETIAVYGKYYINKYGNKTGITFSEFKILD